MPFMFINIMETADMSAYFRTHYNNQIYYLFILIVIIM